MYFYHRHQKVVDNLLCKLCVVISDAVDYTKGEVNAPPTTKHSKKEKRSKKKLKVDRCFEGVFGGERSESPRSFWVIIVGQKFLQSASHFDSFCGLSWRMLLICLLLRPPGLTFFAVAKRSVS